ncbi:MAG: hypothetical protein IPP77_00085 [Bacteroidetes bacterium]|nr:hypothetical protein [Bacteroidota bacterium]
MEHISLKFLLLGIYDKVEFSRETTVEMAAIPLYNPPKITYADIILACDRARDTYTAWKNNPNDNNKNIYLAAEQDLDNLMRQQALSVGSLANGNAVVITDAGFQTTDSERTTPALPSAIEGMTVKHGPFDASIEVNCKSKRTELVNDYVAIIMSGNWVPPVVNGNVVSFQEGTTRLAIDSSKDRHKIFTNLQPGINYWVGMYAVNSTGAGPINAPIRLMAAG